MAEHPGMRTIRRGAGGPARIDCDVCVVGSGAAGLSAALEAQALGKDVVLVDGAPQIGGQAVNSFIGTICGLYSNGPDPYRVTYGVMDGLLSDLFSAGAANARRARNTTIVDYSANAWMRWAERQVAEREITPLLGAVLRDVAREGERIVELSLATRWGDYAIRPRYVIDASGDAVVPWLAGLPLNEADQEIYGTVMAVFENVDVAVSDTIPRGDYHEAMRRRGAEFGLIRFDGFIFSMAEEGKVLLNQTHIPTPQDAVGINRAMFEGRRQVDGLLALFREEFPQASPMHGLRPTARPASARPERSRGRAALPWRTSATACARTTPSAAAAGRSSCTHGSKTRPGRYSARFTCTTCLMAPWCRRAWTIWWSRGAASTPSRRRSPACG